MFCIIFFSLFGISFRETKTSFNIIYSKLLFFDYFRNIIISDWMNEDYYYFIFCRNFFCGTLVLVGWRAHNSFIATWSYVLNANNSTISTLPFAVLQHMQQCQVNFSLSNTMEASFWSKWIVHAKWSLQWPDSNPWPYVRESSSLTTRPFHVCFAMHSKVFAKLPLHSKVLQDLFSTL